MSQEIFAAAEKTLGVAGHKAKDIPELLGKLKAEYGVEASVSGGLLKLSQGDTVMDIGAAMQTYRTKYPADFYGNTDINFKADLKDDQEGKIAFISKHGYEKWAALPFDEKSLDAKHVVNGTVPSEYMKRDEYARLSVTEKSKLAGEVGWQGISKILARKK
jgi:hypothetical protein